MDDRFWKRIVTSDEKWVYVVNRNRQKRWVPQGQNPPSVPRQDCLGKKVMICVWWNFEGVLHFELVPDGRAVNAELCLQQAEGEVSHRRSSHTRLVSARQREAAHRQENKGEV